MKVVRGHINQIAKKKKNEANISTIMQETNWK